MTGPEPGTLVPPNLRFGTTGARSGHVHYVARGTFLPDRIEVAFPDGVNGIAWSRLELTNHLGWDGFFWSSLQEFELGVRSLPDVVFVSFVCS